LGLSHKGSILSSFDYILLYIVFYKECIEKMKILDRVWWNW